MVLCGCNDRSPKGSATCVNCGSRGTSGRWMIQYAEAGRTAIGPVVERGDRFLVAGSVTDAAETTRGWLAELTSQGDIAWQRQYGVDGSRVGINAVRVNPDGALLVVGTIAAGSESTLWVALLSQDGNLQWSVGLYDPDRLLAGSLVFGAEIDSTTIWATDWRAGSPGRASLIIKVTGDGQLSTAQMLNGGGIYNGLAKSTGETVLVGSSSSALWLAALDADTSLLWSTCVNGESAVVGTSVAETSDGDLVVTGVATTDIVLAKFGGDGDLLWNMAYGPLYRNAAIPRVVSLENGEHVIVVSRDVDDIRIATTVFGTASDGELLWQRDLSGAMESDNMYMGRVVATSDGDLLVAGANQQPSGSNDNSLVARISADDGSGGGCDRDWPDLLPQQTTDATVTPCPITMQPFDLTVVDPGILVTTSAVECECVCASGP